MQRKKGWRGPGIILSMMKLFLLNKQESYNGMSMNTIILYYIITMFMKGPWINLELNDYSDRGPPTREHS